MSLGHNVTSTTPSLLDTFSAFPNFDFTAFKRDVFPGNVTNKFQVTIDKEGAYVGHCAELCGAYHAMMNFEVRAVTPDEYQRFIQARKSGMSTPEALRSIGQPPFATTTHPFTPDEQQRQATS